MFSSLRALTADIQSAGGAGHVLPMASSSAETQEPMSPTNGATIATLLSISLGSMSIWMNFFDPDSPQLLPLPCDRSQLRRAPLSITPSGSFGTGGAAAPPHPGTWAGNRPLALPTWTRGLRAFPP